METLPELAPPTYYDQIFISPAQISLTFLNTLKSDDKKKNNSPQTDILGPIISALGVAIGNLDESPISLKNLHLINCFDNSTSLSSKIIQHYKENAVSQLLRIVGSLNIIGNPVGLFYNVTTGFTDLYEKPSQGLVKGPLEAGMGLM